MIYPKELSVVAKRYGLKDLQVEKDYVLSWILYGIANNEMLSNALVFKGGTVLKKVYFEDYRFSEDLDFTLINEKLTNDDLLKEFEKIYTWIKKQSNITLQFKESNIHESGSITFYINYVGPLQSAIGSRDIKVDITRGEIMEFEVTTKKIFKQYSDLPEESFSIQCYTLEEVLIEKMAALMGRTEPRDLYDFWYLTENHGLDTKHHKPEFERKAKNKGHTPNQFEEKVLVKQKNLKQAWDRKLENQIQDLPKFDDVFREAKRNFKI